MTRISRWVAVLLGFLVMMGRPAAHAQQAAPTAEAVYSQATSFYDQQLYLQAIDRLAQFRARYPEHVLVPEALYQQAKANLALERQQQALALFRQLQQQYPGHPKAQEAQLSMAQYLIDQGNVARGRSMLQEVASSGQPALAARALYTLGTMAQDAGRYAQALGYYQQVTQQYPQSPVAPAAYYAQGVTQVQLERYEAAAQSLEAVARRYPQSQYVQTIGTALAEVYYELGQYQRVVDELLGRLPQLQGEAKMRAYFFLAEAYNQLRQPQNARVYYDRVLAQGPSSDYHRPALVGMGWNAHFQGQHAQAAQYFMRAAAGHTDARAARATYQAAVNYELAGQAQEALQAFQTVVRQWPQHRLVSQARYEVGYLQYKQGNYAAAARALQQVVEAPGETAPTGEALYLLGNALVAQGQLDAALKRYNQAIARNAAPDSLREEIRFHKAWTLYQNGRYAEAAPAFVSVAQTAPRSQQRREDALFWSAESFFQTEQYRRALEQANQYLQQYPNGRHATAAYYVLAWTYFKQGRYREAIPAFQAFLNRQPPTGKVPYVQDARLRLGDSHYALKQYDAAMQAYQKVRGAGGDYAQYQIGQAHYFADQPQEAIAAFRTLVQQYPQSPWRPEALYRIGQIQFEQSSYQEAIAVYRRLIEAYPQSQRAALAQYGIGDAHFNAGRMQQAVQAYRAVLNRYPQSDVVVDAASSMQYAYIATNQENQMQTVIDSFATANPQSDLVARLRFQQAVATYQSGNTQEALREFQQFVRTSSNERLVPAAYYYLGIINADRGAEDVAINYLNQLITSYPESDRRTEAGLRLGDIYLANAQYEEAMRAYRAAAEAARANAELKGQARYGEAVALLQLGRIDDAEALLQDVVGSAGGGPLAASARLGLGRVYEAQGRTEAALQAYRRVANGTQTEAGAEALYRLRRLLRAQGKPQQAIEQLQRMNTLFAGYPEWRARALLEQARAYEQMGQTGEAVQLYQQVETNYAGTPYAQTAQTARQRLMDAS
ncbi:tetratricopeptide repeat protein [Salisaeta longa]|uniref:tetratricopeptide repeat protein n=1 Tax=Salisaeta longa TaxID=503170 RepID=UPI00146DFCE5|nr:tetratricopeptide repeat protein [Salisaeta longa]